MKLLMLCSCLVLCSGCQLISPIINNYNGVRMDVAHEINHAWHLSFKQRQILIEYAKQQQKITAWSRLTPAERSELAQARLLGRHCTMQRIRAGSLTWIDTQIFADAQAYAQYMAMQQMQQKMQLDLQKINCTDKF